MSTPRFAWSSPSALLVLHVARCQAWSSRSRAGEDPQRDARAILPTSAVTTAGPDAREQYVGHHVRDFARVRQHSGS
jgi:hypothetical protein